MYCRASRTEHLEVPKRSDLRGSSRSCQDRLGGQKDKEKRREEAMSLRFHNTKSLFVLGFPNALKARGRGAPGQFGGAAATCVLYIQQSWTPYIAFISCTTAPKEKIYLCKLNSPASILTLVPSKQPLLSCLRLVHV